MYRSLNVETLGITGRQSELIELALSYRFKGLDIDIEAFARQVESRGQEYATRCLDSANKRTGLTIGVWQLPVSWTADEARLKAQMMRLPALANVAKSINATRCVTVIPPGSNDLQLKESFDFYAAKLNEIGELLAPHGISLGVGFSAAEEARKKFENQAVYQAETLKTLLSMVHADNVGFYLDTWNWHLGGGTIDQAVALGADKIVAISVADVPAGVDASTIKLNQRLMPTTEGVIAHTDLLNRLHEAEFEGPVTPTPSTSQYKGITRDKLVKLAAESLRSVWPGADLLEEAEAEAAEAGGSDADDSDNDDGDGDGDESSPKSNGEQKTVNA